MRRLFSIATLAVAALMMLATACKKDAPAPTPEDPKSPTVAVEITAVRASDVDFTITTTNAQEVYYLLANLELRLGEVTAEVWVVEAYRAVCVQRAVSSRVDARWKCRGAVVAECWVYAKVDR